MRATVGNLGDADRQELADLGIPHPIFDLFELVGIGATADRFSELVIALLRQPYPEAFQ